MAVSSLLSAGINHSLTAGPAAFERIAAHREQPYHAITVVGTRCRAANPHSGCPPKSPSASSPLRQTLAPKHPRRLKRLRRVEELAPVDQRVVLRLVDAMLDTRRRSTPPTPARKRRAS